MTKRQQRGEERRAQVLQATLRVLAREGTRGVTHRAVAKEAGTSLRSTTYYFSSREELLVEALRHYATTAIKRFDELAMPVEQLLQGRDNPLEVAAQMLAFTVLSDLGEDRDGLIAEYELVLEISRNPALEEDYRRWQESLERILRGYAGALGSPTPELDARLVLATLRGLEIEALARPGQPATAEDLAAVFRRLLGVMAG